jgi:exosome complex exonuclease DIS3/RRP44
MTIGWALIAPDRARVSPQVPKRLGEDLCSLHEKVDRLAFSVIWVVDHEANVISTKVAKTVIRSVAALSYEQVE